MIKHRLIGTIPIHQGVAVQSIAFTRYLPIGAPEITASAFAAWGIDEIILFDIDASLLGVSIDLKHVERVSAEIFVPLTVGGGITNLDDITTLLLTGADKVLINSGAFENRNLIQSAAKRFGSQCIVVGVDVKLSFDGKYRVVTKSGAFQTETDAIELAAEYESLGAGELLVNCIDQDGRGNGYNITLAKKISERVSLPVIFAGGAGHPRHIMELFKAADVSTAVGNMLHYTEHSVAVIKAYLADKGLAVRDVKHLEYKGREQGPDGRINKLPDLLLERQIFETVIEELI